MILVLRNAKFEVGKDENGKIPYDILKLTSKKHVEDVRKGMAYFCDRLNEAGKKHDYTKGFNDHCEPSETNSNEFHKALISGVISKSLWYRFHTRTERHHLLTHPPEDIDLVDVIEHLVDCVMASAVRGGEFYDISLPNSLLQKAHRNTITKLRDEIQVVDI